RIAEGVGGVASIVPIPGAKHVGKYGTKGIIEAGEFVADAAINVANKVKDVGGAKSPRHSKSPPSPPKKKLTLAEKIKYRRPSKFRKGVRDKAWDYAKGSDGKVRDPLTKKVMNKEKPWDMGHKPGYEFRKHQISAAEREISRKQFLDEHNNPEHYRPELPSSNRSHVGEDPSDSYFGP
ncbi:HNH/ENDO VII family nuclease, partial [Schinkia azotoformans]|uniref:HNH/ENDO VII family nuclease n=1 Tax=Schinkia azotoformans TaxID=1454 RepID=UPI002E1C3469|nr:HNH/ENDO VII family nuclease [Schinkia azotoformans]